MPAATGQSEPVWRRPRRGADRATDRRSGLDRLRAWGQNVPGEGDSPIFRPGHRKIGTVPDVLSPGSKLPGPRQTAPLAAKSPFSTSGGCVTLPAPRERLPGLSCLLPRRADHKGGPVRVAIVHDWFVTYAGSERVVEQLIALFPQADVFSLLDFL